jgi:dimeric dUTPase (all-alpha-NTP-PPase superfamily)
MATSREFPFPQSESNVKHQFLTMLQLQEDMNAKVHRDWRGQGYQWYRAIWIECAELMDHHGWKWWKKQTADREQVILELIDIWHFGLSSLLQQESDKEKLAAQLQLAMSAPEVETDFLKSVEVFAQVALERRGFDATRFAGLLVQMDVSFNRLFQSYVGKNVLNFFRQDKGYKEGSYQKVWQGKEDNVHLVEILESLDLRSATYRDDIYRALLERYPA